MNKERFMEQLEASLGRISKEERQDILQDYEEYFEIGMEQGKTEQEIAASLGSPKQIAKELLAAYHLEQAEKSASAGNVMRAVWAALGLGFFNIVIVLGPFVALLGVMLAGWVTSLTFIVAPVAMLFNIVIGSFKLFDFFLSIAMCGVGIFIAMGMFVASKALVKGFIRYLQFNASLVKGGMKSV